MVVERVKLSKDGVDGEEGKRGSGRFFLLRDEDDAAKPVLLLPAVQEAYLEIDLIQKAVYTAGGSG